MAKLIGTDPNQVPSNADLGTAAYTNVQSMPNVIVGETQQGIRYVDPGDNYALRINGYDYYSSGIKVSRTGTGTYTGSLMFEKIKTDASGNVTDAKTGDTVMQLYSSVTNDSGAYCAASSIRASLIEDAADQTSVAGRISFQPDGDNTTVVSVDADGIKFNGDTAAANALNDYEEGTWTPSGGSNITVNSVVNAKYTKIGNTVVFTAWFKANPTAFNPVLDGMPFSQVGRTTATWANISQQEVISCQIVGDLIYGYGATTTGTNDDMFLSVTIHVA